DALEFITGIRYQETIQRDPKTNAIVYSELVKENNQPVVVSRIKGLLDHGITIDRLAINNGTAHGNNYDKEGNLIQTQMNIRTTQAITEALKPFNIEIVQHGVTGTPLSTLPMLRAAGIASAHVGTHWQNIVWDTLTEKAKEDSTIQALVNRILTTLVEKYGKNYKVTSLTPSPEEDKALHAKNLAPFDSLTLAQDVGAKRLQKLIGKELKNLLGTYKSELNALPDAVKDAITAATRQSAIEHFKAFGTEGVAEVVGAGIIAAVASKTVDSRVRSLPEKGRSTDRRERRESRGVREEREPVLSLASSAVVTKEYSEKLIDFTPVFLQQKGSLNTAITAPPAVTKAEKLFIATSSETITDGNSVKQRTTLITTADDFSKTASRRVASEIRKLQANPDKQVTIVFATGNTMVGFLDNLSKESNIDWKRVQAFHLDEYKGLPTDHPASFAYFLNKNLFSKVALPKENIHYVNGANPDIKVYLQTLKSFGGADIVMLGVGMDGHLAFNEPPVYSRFDSRMQEVSLTDSTIEANREDYPEITNNPYAYTMGMADIFEGKHLFFLANKAKKADIVKKSLEGPVTEDVPASLLQKHSKVTVVLDTEAARLLTRNYASDVTTDYNVSIEKDSIFNLQFRAATENIAQVLAGLSTNNAISVKKFGPDIQVVIVVNPAPNARAYFDRKKGWFTWDGKGIGGDMVKLVGLKHRELLKSYFDSDIGRNSTLRHSLADTDLYTCDYSWKLVDGKLYAFAEDLIRGQDGLFELRQKPTFGFVITENGQRIMEDLILKGFQRRELSNGNVEFFGGDVYRASDNQKITNVKQGTFLKKMLQGHQAVPLAEVAPVLVDTKWMFKLPRFERPRARYEWPAWFLGTVQLSSDSKKKILAAEGGIISLDLKELDDMHVFDDMGRETKEAEIVSRMATSGYQRVRKEAEIVRRGDYVLDMATNQIYLRLHEGVNPLNIIGLDRDSNIYTVEFHGKISESGTTLTKAAQYLADLDLEVAGLLSESGDVRAKPSVFSGDIVQLSEEFPKGHDASMVLFVERNPVTISSEDAVSNTQLALASSAASTAAPSIMELESAYRKPIIGGNLKREFKHGQTRKLIFEIAEELQNNPVDPDKVDVFIAPSEVYLSEAARAISELEAEGKLPKGFIKLGAQNVARRDKLGAFSGQHATATQLKEMKVSHVIIGHSEVRHGSNEDTEDIRFQESSKVINAKVRAAIAAGLTPVLAFGEDAQERASGREFDLVRRQIT
ncbi:MAG: triose-phosphate isomerase, partial [Candidatus Omnitrophota bacterium]